MRATLVGAVESTEVALRALSHAEGWELAQVVTLESRLAGRHSDFVDLSGAAAAAGAELVAVAKANSPEVLDRMHAAEPDFLFVIGWSQICGPEMLAIPGQGTIGYHPAPLPRLRGRAAIPWTILLDEPITAGTLFWIDAGVDSGPIFDQEFFHLAPDETAGSLYERHMAALARMLERSLPGLAAGRARRDVQDERFATWSARRVAEDGLIDWRLAARDIDRLVRAVGRPYPGAFTSVGGEKLTVWRAAPSRHGGRHAAVAGQIVARDVENGGFTVACGGGEAVDILEWEGPAAMPPLHARLEGPA